MRIEEFKRDIWTCNHCSMCTGTVSDEGEFYKTCPAYEQLRFEDSSARGHNTVAFYLLQGSLKYSKEVADSTYNCTTCASCVEICKPMSNMITQMGGSALKTLLPRLLSPLGAEMEPIQSVAIIEAMRADCVDLGLQPDSLKKLAVSTEKNYNPYEEPHASRTKWAEGLDIPQSAETVLFVGCNSSYRRPEIAKATAKILKRAGVEFAILPDEWCCGSPLLRNGNVNLAEEMIQHNVELLKGKNVKRLVTPCAEGYMGIGRDWPRFAGELPFKVMHISELLAELIAGRKIRFTKPINAKVTYHDPCHLGREMGIYDEPRAVLKAIPGIELVEMYPTQHAAWCCGAGGGVKVSNPELALDIGAEKIPLIKETGASVLASACPFCKTHFTDVIERAKEKIGVKDITELVAESMGV
jgi:heterodisulfide reductase subunit D